MKQTAVVMFLLALAMARPLSAETVTITGDCAVYPIGAPASPETLIATENYPGDCSDLGLGTKAFFHYGASGNGLHTFAYVNVSTEPSRQNYVVANFTVTVSSSEWLEVTGGSGDGYLKADWNQEADGISGFGYGTVVAPGVNMVGSTGDFLIAHFTIPFTFNVPFLVQVSSVAYGNGIGNNGCASSCSGDSGGGVTWDGIYDSNNNLLSSAQVIEVVAPEPSTLLLCLSLIAVSGSRTRIPRMRINANHASSSRRAEGLSNSHLLCV